MSALAKPVALPFAAGPQGEWLEFAVNTAGMAVGPYALTIGQQGGGKAELAVAIQPPAPALPRSAPSRIGLGWS